MANYDYKEGKKRVKEILNNNLDIINQAKLPANDKLTFDNAYKCWITGIFVDIRDSSSLFEAEDEKKTSKIIRGFTSEIIEILDYKDDNLREIGIRGDCVYAVYTTPNKSDIKDVYINAAYINTYMRMLNKLLDNKGYPNIQAGIGIATQKELVVKAGRKNTGINSKVWIGAAVTKASNLSSIGNNGIYDPIIISYVTYNNLPERAQGFFTKRKDSEYGNIYEGTVIMTEFNDWILSGMPD